MLPRKGQTAFTGADSDGKTLAMTDILYTDCYQNGVKLEADHGLHCIVYDTDVGEWG